MRKQVKRMSKQQTLANLSSAEEGTSEDEVEIEKLFQAQKSRNTQYKTKGNLNTWTKFCESLKESRANVNIPAKEHDLLLSKFFISVRKNKMAPGMSHVYIKPNSITQTRRFLITPLGGPVLDDSSKKPKFIAQLSGDIN